MIKIICVGKVKEKFFSDAVKEYDKRISKYTKLQIIEVPDVFAESIDICLKKEAEYIQKYITPKDFVITLEINGNMLSSLELSKKIESIIQVNSNIAFIIGGSYGLSDTIKLRSDYALSFSKLTFPHQMFRVILLEQLYRSFKIMNNESYHK